MSKKQVAAEPVVYHFDWFKWLVVVVIVGAVAVGNSLYAEESLLYRILAAVVLAIFACAIAAQTKAGAAFWDLAKGSRAEIRRVVWPTKTERNRATLMVVIFVVAAAFLLWLLDLLFGWLGSLLLG